MRRSGFVLATGAAALLALSCSEGGSGGSGQTGAAPVNGAAPGAAPGASSGQPAPAAALPAPGLVSATFLDRDGDRRPSRGDRVDLEFDADADLSGLAVADLALLGNDTFGGGAAVAAAGPRTAAVTLGDAPRLALYDTYRPGRGPGPGASPAAVALARPAAVTAPGGAPAARAGRPVPVLVPRAARESYQGERFPVSTSRPAFYGTLHAHTGFSDGKLDPARAFDWARTQGGLDFFATTDHLEQVTPFPSRWAETKRMADAATVDGQFVALHGYEWGHGVARLFPLPLKMYNHVNVFADDLVPIAGSLTATGLYAEVSALPEGAVAKFNHPGSYHKPHIEVSNWDDYRYDGRADLRFALMRCHARSDDDDAHGLIPALDAGWHLSPASSQDNHEADWGSRDDFRTGLYLDRLARADVLQAMREGRAFSTSDRNASVRLVADGEVFMGGTVHGPGPVALRVEWGDADGEALAQVEIVTANGAVIHAVAGPAGPVDVTVDPPADAYFYARLRQQDGGVLYSAPVYVDR